MDTPPITPNMTMGTEGGITGPIVDDAAVTPAEKGVSKPFSSIARISMVPSPAQSATALPLIPAKITLVRTFATPRPPGSRPTTSFAKSKILYVMPPVFISLPANRKNGTASRVKLLAPLTIFCAMTSNGIPVIPRSAIRIIIDVKPMA